MNPRSPAPHRRDDDDAEWLARRLRELPDLPAPPSLIPRVLAAVRAREAAAPPWWRRAWWEWPRPAQAVSLVAVSLALGLLGLLGEEIRAAMANSGWREVLLEWRAQAAPLLQAGHALAHALATLLSSFTRSVLLLAGGAFLLLYLLCLGLGTLLYRLICTVHSRC